MSYYGAQGLYTKNPVYRHPDGTVSHERPARRVGYHDACAHAVFDVDTTQEGYGSWHHDKGMSWQPWNAGVDCEVCGQPC